MNRQRAYTVVLERDDEVGVYVVSVPALPGVLTQGEAVDEASANARQAIQLHIECLEADGLPVPEENGSVVTSVFAIAA